MRVVRGGNENGIDRTGVDRLGRSVEAMKRRDRIELRGVDVGESGELSALDFSTEQIGYVHASHIADADNTKSHAIHDETSS